MAPRRRMRSTRRTTIARTPTPEEPSEPEVEDAGVSEPQSPAQDDDMEDADQDGGAEAEVVNDEDEAASAANESEASNSRAGSPPPTRGRGRGRGRGRRGRPRVRPLGSERSQNEDSLEGSDTGTPKPRRGRGRGFGAGRWANRKAGGQRQEQLPQDADGNQLSVENDEAVVPDDPEGETKVDRNGNLLGGREYRVRVFSVLGRGDRKYMLSTEPARCIGFRDSYLFFQKHRVLYKIILSDDEKMDLIERDMMPHSYKGRSIGVVTARSVFREFGARIVIGGRNIVDDYFIDRARETGVVEGELAVPEDVLPGPGQEYNRNQYVAWHGASAVYHTNGPAMPLQVGEKPKRRIPITSANWMLEHARQASQFNSRLGYHRRANWNGVYDVHTNLLLYPKITQPTHARWEMVSTTADHSKTTGPHSSEDSLQSEISEAEIPPIDSFISRNYMVTDSIYVSPPVSNLGIPGRDGRHQDIACDGLTQVPQDVVDALKGQDRADFLAARAQEAKWRRIWKDEKSDTRRAGQNGLQDLEITYHTWSREA